MFHHSFLSLKYIHSMLILKHNFVFSISFSYLFKCAPFYTLCKSDFSQIKILNYIKYYIYGMLADLSKIRLHTDTSINAHLLPQTTNGEFRSVHYYLHSNGKDPNVCVYQNHTCYTNSCMSRSVQFEIQWEQPNRPA